MKSEESRGTVLSETPKLEAVSRVEFKFIFSARVPSCIISSISEKGLALIFSTFSATLVSVLTELFAFTETATPRGLAAPPANLFSKSRIRSLKFLISIKSSLRDSFRQSVLNNFLACELCLSIVSYLDISSAI